MNRSPHHTRIAIIEDAPDYRDILSMAIQLQPDMSVVGAFSAVEQFLREDWKPPPDIVLMDIQLPGMSGIEGVLEIRQRFPDTDVIMITVFEDDGRIFQSLQSGAVGYLLKSSTIEEIFEAVREVTRGGAPMTPKIARKVLGSFKQPRRMEPEEQLSDRELEILELLGKGMSYPQIAQTLYLSHGTVQTYVKRIYRKLEIHSKLDIVSILNRRKDMPNKG
jgi:DNA-binding NarL/FixJ family response regulator